MPRPATHKPMPGVRLDKIRSRRRAALRVVGSEAPETRHLFKMEHHFSGKLAEILTFAEMARTPPEHRPRRGWIVPGIGWLFIREYHNDSERDDVEDMAAVAMQTWQESLPE